MKRRILLDQIQIILQGSLRFCQQEMKQIVGLRLIGYHQHAVKFFAVRKNLTCFIEFIHIAVEQLRHQTFSHIRIRDLSVSYNGSCAKQMFKSSSNLGKSSFFTLYNLSLSIFFSGFPRHLSYCSCIGCTKCSFTV